MKLRNLLTLVLVGISISSRAAVAPPEKLLPSDALMVITIPNVATARAVFTNSANGRLWSDPAMRPFADKFLNKFTSDVLQPVEREFGVKFSDYQAMAQGQITYAILPGEAQDKTNQSFAKVLLLDAKDQAEKLKKNLADVKAKWTESGKQAKVEKIRDLEFTTLMTTTEELNKTWDKIFPKNKTDKNAEEPPAKAPPEKIEITFGQVESLLIISDSPKAIEKILVRQSGGLIPALADQPDFQANYAALFRDAPFYVWVNVKALIDPLLRMAAGNSAEPGNLMGIRPEKALAALGLTGIKTAALTYRDTPEGATTQFFIGVPAGDRRGIFKILAPDVADANPLPFVPADAIKFNRWRLNLSKGWTQLESMLTEISPAVGGVSKMLFESAGKDKDEKYDLKSELLGNLGNDVISYDKAPRGATLANLKSNPSIVLLGSPNGDKLAAAIKVGISALNPNGVKDREFLGRKIYTLETSAPGAKGEAKSFSFVASGGYVAMSSDVGILEEYLRSNETKAKPLSETVGLTLAAQKVGGMGTGFFGFNNQNEEMKATLETLRKESGTLADIAGSGIMNMNVDPAEQIKKLKEWADFSLLPPYETISKYFYYSVSAGSFTPEGFTWKFFSPTPPGLKAN